MDIFKKNSRICDSITWTTESEKACKTILFISSQCYSTGVFEICLHFRGRVCLSSLSCSLHKAIVVLENRMKAVNFHSLLISARYGNNFSYSDKFALHAGLLYGDIVTRMNDKATGKTDPRFKYHHYSAVRKIIRKSQTCTPVRTFNVIFRPLARHTNHWTAGKFRRLQRHIASIRSCRNFRATSSKQGIHC